MSAISHRDAPYTDERHGAALNAFGGYCWVTSTVLDRLQGLR